MSDAPVYMIVMLDIEDMGTFMQDYAGPLQAIHAKHGVETLVASPSVEVLEGKYSKTVTVVLKFPSETAQRAWYGDRDYQALLKRRFELTNTETSVALLAPHVGTELSERGLS